MDKAELYLKTIFCCMACDGEIVKEEIEMVKRLGSEYDIFAKMDVESCINKWIMGLNKNGTSFLKGYLNELSKADLSLSEQLLVIDFAIKTIEADEHIEYSEIRFFKKLRNRLPISDDKILEQHPDKEDFLLPDIHVMEEPLWDDSVQFAEISLKS